MNILYTSVLDVYYFTDYHPHFIGEKTEASRYSGAEAGHRQGLRAEHSTRTCREGTGRQVLALLSSVLL